MSTSNFVNHHHSIQSNLISNIKIIVTLINDNHVNSSSLKHERQFESHLYFVLVWTYRFGRHVLWLWIFLFIFHYFLSSLFGLHTTLLLVCKIIFWGNYQIIVNGKIIKFLVFEVLLMFPKTILLFFISPKTNKWHLTSEFYFFFPNMNLDVEYPYSNFFFFYYLLSLLQSFSMYITITLNQKITKGTEMT